MNLNYEFDYVSITLVFLGIVIGAYLIFFGKEKVTPKSIYSSIILGFLLIIISVVFNSLYNHNWSSDHIIAFLLLKNVGRSGTILLNGGYVIVGLGIALLIAFIRNRKKKK
ncbi:MAG: hypothetical protein EPN88_07230 [Bacteroidetes bacterium]|nr:MAG: hypothetical protein EPN88_07230 [Bacteroidota bacterium]